MAEVRGRMIAGARRLLGHSRDEALVAGVRRRDRRAFEAIYERHAAQLLTFCIYLLGSRHDAEDALQATFASAYRALLSDSRPVSLRPWLFTIARNECLSILRKRRPLVELNGEVALTGDPVKLAEVHEEMASMIGGIRELPEKQRAALVLAEVHGMSHADIGSVLGVRPEQVKAFVFQARSNLLSDRHAREVDCREIREELATSRGLVSKRARLRRHLRSCDACRAYADGVERQHRQLASLLPILPSLTLKYRAIDQALRLCGSDAANYANSASMAGHRAGSGRRRDDGAGREGRDRDRGRRSERRGGHDGDRHSHGLPQPPGGGACAGRGSWGRARLERGTRTPASAYTGR